MSQKDQRLTEYLTPVAPTKFADAMLGDSVVRVLSGNIHMPLTITELSHDTVSCGPWKFCRHTGAEIDPYLDWGPPPKCTGSVLTKPEKHP